MTKKLSGQHVVQFMFDESFKAEAVKGEDGDVKWLRISGKAMPTSGKSRNRVAYRKDSVIASAKSLSNVTITHDHDTKFPVGRTTSAKVSEDGKFLMFEGRIHRGPMLNGMEYYKYVEDGILENPSIQAVVSDVEYDEKEDFLTVSIEEIVELGIVPIPGFGNATVGSESAYTILTESMHMSEDHKPDEGDDEMAEHMERLAKIEESLSKVLEGNARIEKRLTALEKSKKKEEEDDDDDEDDEEEGNKKKKNKKQKNSLPTDDETNRQSVDSGSMSGPDGSGNPRSRSERMADMRKFMRENKEGIE